MKKTIISIVVILTICCFRILGIALTANTNSPDKFTTYNNCSMTNSAFQAGEQIIYKLYYNWKFIWLPAGEVTFEVFETGKEYRLSAIGRTYASYEWFFKVRDYYAAYIDKETLLPHTSIREVHEGGYHLFDKISYDQENKMVTSLRGNNRADAKPTQYQLKNCMHDILSIIYYTRNIDFENYAGGTEFPVAIFMDKEVWPLKLSYLGTEQNVKVRGQGRFNTIKFRPEVIAGEVFNDGAEMNIWVTNDLNRIPLLIESDVSVGSVKAVLKSCKGLRHPLESKVK